MVEAREEQRRESGLDLVKNPDKLLRIGAGASFADDRIAPAVDLAERGELDYLVFECLAERTVARENLTRMKDPEKGYTPRLLDRMGAVLRSRGSRRALLSAGHSSVLALGGKGRGWPVDLRPRLASRRVGRLWVKNGAIGTSGAGEQFVEIDGRRYGHVIDPRTGRPAEGVLGASVITRDAASADALSTAFLIGGPDLARRYCAAHRDVLAVLVLDEPRERTTVFGQYHGATLEMLT